MASSLSIHPITTAAAAVAVATGRSSSSSSRRPPRSFSAISLPSSTKGLHHILKISTAVVKAQSKELRHFRRSDLFFNFRSSFEMFLGSPFKVASNGFLHAAASASGSKDALPSVEPSPDGLASKESISEFISQVADLIKIVDSRDIVELQLKQLDCELLIRKKVALPQPPNLAPPVAYHSPAPTNGPSVFSSAPVPAPIPAPAPSPAPSSLPPSADSSLPSLKCPMAGTFYRSPAPGEPPFVKKGDKVQKGQVLCIIEAMKLMNEIEADQSGTIVDILVEDGKPVSLDMPLFIIKP